MKGKLFIESTEELDKIIENRFFESLYMEMQKIPIDDRKVVSLIAESSFSTGFYNCLNWLKEKRVLKIKVKK